MLISFRWQKYKIIFSLQALRIFFFSSSPDFFRGTLRIKSSSSLLSNVSHVARVSKEFVLIARQCTARCSQRVAQRKCWLIDNYFKEYKHLKSAEPHEQHAVHCVCYENELLLYNNLFFTQREWGEADVYALKGQTAPCPGQSRLPFQGVLQPPRTMRALLFRFLLGAPPNR